MFSLLGLAGVGASRMITAELPPFLLVASALLLGRAHYLIHFRMEGNRWSRVIVWVATLTATTLWISRFLGG